MGWWGWMVRATCRVCEHMRLGIQTEDNEKLEFMHIGREHTSLGHGAL